MGENVKEAQKKTADAKRFEKQKAKKKPPLWVIVGRTLYLFFIQLFRTVYKYVKIIFLWIVDFFTGLPGGIRYLFRRTKGKISRYVKNKKTERLKKTGSKSEKKQKIAFRKDKIEERKTSERTVAQGTKRVNVGNIKTEKGKAVPAQGKTDKDEKTCGTVKIGKEHKFRKVGKIAKDRETDGIKKADSSGGIKKPKKTDKVQVDAEKIRWVPEKGEERKNKRGRTFTALSGISRTTVAVAVCVLLFYELLLCALVGLFYLRDRFSLPEKPVTMTTVIGGIKRRNTVSAKNAYSDDGKKPYFSMSALAEEMDISTVSDGTTVVYTLPCGQTAKMKKDSHTVILDGSMVTLSSPVRISGGKVYVPVEMLTLYTEGLNVSLGDGVLTILQETDEEKSLPQQTVYREFRFAVSGIRPADTPLVVEE